MLFSFLACRIGAIFSRFFGRTRSERTARERVDGKIVSRARRLISARLKNAKKSACSGGYLFPRVSCQLGRNTYGQ